MTPSTPSATAADPAVRALGRDEWRLYRDVRLAALRDSPQAFATSYDAAIGMDESEWREALALPCWVAFRGDEAVGMVRLSDVRDGRAHLLSMWVAPAARGSLAGEALVEAALRAARTAGADCVDLRVVTANTRAQSFYRRCGFVPTDATFTLPDGRPEIEMVHRFTP